MSIKRLLSPPETHLIKKHATSTGRKIIEEESAHPHYPFLEQVAGFILSYLDESKPELGY